MPIVDIDCCAMCPLLDKPQLVCRHPDAHDDCLEIDHDWESEAHPHCPLRNRMLTLNVVKPKR